MKYEKTKVVRGGLVYQLGSNTYLDKPDGCYQVGMYYNANENLTYIKLRRNRHIIEFLCLILIVYCIGYSFLADRKVTVINCTQTATYYDGTLYLNLKNNENSYYTINCELYIDGECVGTKTLQAGEIWYDIEIPICPSDCFVKVLYDDALVSSVEYVRISVVDWSKQ